MNDGTALWSKSRDRVQARVRSRETILQYSGYEKRRKKKPLPLSLLNLDLEVGERD